MIAALALLAAAPFPNVSVGDTWAGESVYRYSEVAHPKETDESRWREDWKVVAVGEGSVTLDCGKVLIESKMNGQVIPTPTMDPVRRTEVWTAKGVTVEPPFEDPYAHRLWRLRLFGPEGATWSWEGTARLPAATFDASPYSSRPARGALGPARADFSESDGITAVMHGMRDLKTGWVVEGKIEAAEVPMPGGDGSPFNLTISWKTTQFSVKNRIPPMR